MLQSSKAFRYVHLLRAEVTISDNRAASIHIALVVLGRQTGNDERGRRHEYECHRHGSCPDYYPRRLSCPFYVDYRNHALLGTARLLSAIPRQCTWLLVRDLPAQDRALVLHDGGTSCTPYMSVAPNGTVAHADLLLGTPKLLPLGSIRSQLAVPVVFAAPAHLGCPHHGPHLLCGDLGCHAPLRRHPQQEPLVANADLRHRSWCSSLVPDALGCLRYWPVRPLGWRTYRLCHRGSVAVAVVGRTGLRAECRFRHDHAAHSHEVSHLICSYPGAGSGFRCDYVRERLRARQPRSWPRVPEPWLQCCQRPVQCMVLDCAVLPAVDQCFGPEILQEGAAVQALKCKQCSGYTNRSWHHLISHYHA